MLTDTDLLALDVLEEVKPAELRGLFPYRSWLDMFELQEVRRDAAWRKRILGVKPCVAAGELGEAKTALSKTSLGAADAAAAAPGVCRS
jgi:hypothetical protein